MKFTTRPGTMDDYIVSENSYKKASFTKKDVWFDIGGNIGAFAVKNAGLVKRIYSFEPESENFSLLVENLSNNNIKNVRPFRRAVVGNEDKKRSFFLNTKTNKATHSFYVKRGRDEVKVACKNINSLLEKYKPNKLKVDVEGSEYEILTGIASFHGIEEIILEFHFAQLKDAPEFPKYKEVVSLLTENFNHVDYLPVERIGKNWTTIIHAKNL